MFSCPKEHLTPLEEFCTFLCQSECSCKQLWKEHLFLLFSSLSLSSSFPKIFFEHLLCAGLWVICTGFSCGSGVFSFLHMQRVAQIC